MKLDGTETHKHLTTPFDAHEQVVRGTHVHEAGEYKAVEHEHRDFPKAVSHNPETGEPMIALSAEDEAELAGSATKDAKPAKGKKVNQAPTRV